MHWGLKGFVRCWSFLKNLLHPPAPFVFDCGVYSIVCHEMKILKEEGFSEQTESCHDLDCCPNGVVQVSGDRRHKLSYTTNPQVLLLNIIAPLSSCPPQHPVGYFWPLMTLDWRLMRSIFLPPPSPLLCGASRSVPQRGLPLITPLVIKTEIHFPLWEIAGAKSG